METISFATSDDPNRSYSLRDIFVLSLYALTTIVALFGNCLVCRVVIKSQKMRTTVNLLIVNMAFSDIICAITIPMQWLLCSQQLLNRYDHLYIGCAISKSIQVLSFYVSSLTFTAIAIDRYIVVHYPIKKIKPKVFIIIVWVISLAFVIFTAVSVKIFTYDFTSDPIITCQVVLRFDFPFSSDILRHIRIIGVILTQYMLPVLTSMLFYAKIIHTIWKRNVGDMIDVQKRHLLDIKKRTIKMLIIVVVVFAICWLPVNVIHFVDFYGNRLNASGCNSSTLYLIFYWLGISSCSYNPFIFWWLNHDFRAGAKSVWKYMTCRFIRNRDRISSTSSTNTLVNRKQSNISVF
ncbi:G-protein coupled receptor 83-like [Oppia nitens]|uniref:G-protein coupled receptor 83-like n=1 Tax=Oppia nitens TaxID=1686743 RepID=UPI0023DB2A01|nr:G-protein coupled receptor 83-like [Oppia nitens]